VAVASAGQYAYMISVAPHSKQPCQHLITQFFTRRMLCLTPTSSVKALKANSTDKKVQNNANNKHSKLAMGAILQQKGW